MRYLATHEAQSRVDPQEFRRLEVWQIALWQSILLACTTPGIPVDAPRLRSQLLAIWGVHSATFERLTF